MGLKLSNVEKRYGEKTVVDKVTFEMNKPRCIWTFRNKWSRKNDNNKDATRNNKKRRR